MTGFLDHVRVVADHRIPGMATYALDERERPASQCAA
jgi:hypothetical protein